jgi:hypothetical protein
MGEIADRCEGRPRQEIAVESITRELRSKSDEELAFHADEPNIQPDVETERLSPEVSKWSMARQEVDISGDGEVVLKLVPASY